jgi:signal transduction histidine kinase
MSALQSPLQAQTFLIAAGEAIADSLEFDETLRRVAWAAVPTLADWVFVDVVEAEGTVRRVEVAHADPARKTLAEALKGFAADLDAPVGIGKVLRTGRSELYAELPDELLRAGTQSAEHFRLIREVGRQSVMRVPLIARGRTLGAISLASVESGRHYTDEDLKLAEELARRAAIALDNARLYAAEREARAEAEAAVRARDQFLSTASHELRTPVTTIKASAQLLLRNARRERLQQEQLERYLERIDKTADRLNMLVGDLLDVARLQTGRMPLRAASLDLEAFVCDVTQRFAEHVDDRHTVVVRAIERPSVVTADRDRLEQVLWNLLDNAVKYSPEGGEVGISVGRQDGGLYFEVQDSGIGLTPGSAEAIFEPFGRAPNATERQLPGLGLGLYICRMIVERHGGRIWARSAGEDLGTSVRVWLPETIGPRQDAPPES